MISLIFELIYIIPLCLLWGDAFAGFPGWLGNESKFAVLADLLARPELLCCLVSVAVGVSAVLFYGLRRRGRIVLTGVVISLAAGVSLYVLFLAKNNEVLSDNLPILAVYILMLCAGALVAYGAGRVIIRFDAVQIASETIQILTLLVLLICRVTVDRFVVGMMLFYILIIMTGLLQQSWKKAGYTDSRVHLVYAAPFVLAGVLAISFVKTPDKPYDWHITKKIYTVARDSITIISQMFKIDTDIDTAEANIGFSEDGSLRAGLKERTDIVLSFRSDYQLEKSVYLAGKFFDSFDGKEWHSTTAGYREGYDEKTLDTLITMSQVRQSADHHVEDYVLPVKIDVKYAGARTRYAFAPSKMTMQNSDFGRKKITPAGDGLVFDRTSGMFTEYMISYHRLNRDNSVFRELCEGAQVISEENWNSYAKNALGTAGAVYTYEDYLKYQDYVYDTYLGDAAKENADAAEVNADTSLVGGDAAAQYLSDAMAEELNSFIDPSDDTMTKLAKITDYLAQMSYTRNPGPIPESVDEAADFLDYFCLENRKGFCCHFATAFVLLARSQGIPARYVQGYLVRPKGEKKVRVLSNMAHAWPEVFIDNVGWVTCEATTGYKADKGMIDKGNGDKHILISDDDEANGYHTLFYGLDDSKENLEYALETEHDSHSIDEIVILG